jgi:hypothetical protein
LARARNPRPASGSMDFGLATLSRPGMTKTRVPSYSPPPPVSRSFPDVVSRLRRILDAGVTKASGEPRNCLTGKSDRLQIVRCPALFAKRLRFAPTPNHFYIHHRPVPQRGGSRSSRTRGRMRWTQVAPWTRALSCGRRSRVVLTPRRWRQVLEKQASQGRWWQESPVTKESAKEAVKTIARGMPGVFRCDLTNACALYHYICTRGYRAHRAPGIPCALCSEGRLVRGNNSGASRREMRGLTSCRHCEEHLRRSNPFFLFFLLCAGHGLLRLRSQ